MLRMPKLMDGETGCCRVLNLVVGKLKNLIGTFAAAEPGLVYLFVSRLELQIFRIRRNFYRPGYFSSVRATLFISNQIFVHLYCRPNSPNISILEEAGERREAAAPGAIP